jgi:hypothetical protein
VPQSSSFAALVETKQDLPGCWSALREHALLFDPGGSNASGHYDALSVAFRSVDDVGPAIGHISRLNHTVCSLAVYASRLRITPITPRKTRFPLAANLGGAGLEPAGLLSKVSHFTSTSILFAKLCLAHNQRDAVTLGIGRGASARAKVGPRQLQRQVRRHPLQAWRRQAVPCRE